MAVPPSAAGGGPQEDPLPFNLAAENSRGEGGVVDLDRRLAELHAAADAAAVELDAVKCRREAAEQDLLVPGVPMQAASGFAAIEKLQGTMLNLQQEIGKVYSDLEIKTNIDGEGTCIPGVDFIARKFEQMVIVKSEKDNISEKPSTDGHHDVMTSEGILKDLVCKVNNISFELEVLKGSCRMETLYHAEDALSGVDVVAPKENGKRHSQLAFTETEEECRNSCGLLLKNVQLETDNNEIMQSESCLKDSVDKGRKTITDVNPQGRELDYVEESDEPSFGGSDSSDLDSDSDTFRFPSRPYQDSFHVSAIQRRLQFDAIIEKTRRPNSSCLQRLQFASLIDKTRQPNSSYLQSEDRSLPPLPSLDTVLQLSSGMGNTTTTTTSSSSSSSSSRSNESPNKMNDLEEIYALGGRLATDEEEESLMMDAAIRVGDDAKAMEIICMHDNGVLSSSSHGMSRELLLDQLIVFFAKEQDITSCRVCISDFRTSDRCIRLPCKHIFHMQCIVKWLLEKDTCPVCRRTVSASNHNDQIHEDKERLY